MKYYLFGMNEDENGILQLDWEISSVEDKETNLEEFAKDIVKTFAMRFRNVSYIEMDGCYNIRFFDEYGKMKIYVYGDDLDTVTEAYEEYKDICGNERLGKVGR